MHRGYYCPDIISDKIVGNLSRGTLCKNEKTQKYTFEYGFDSDNALVTVRKFYAEGFEEREFIIYGERQLGILFSAGDEADKIVAISECEYYRGNIGSYTFFLINSADGNTVLSFTRQIYEYRECGMKAHCYEFFPAANDNEVLRIFKADDANNAMSKLLESAGQDGTKVSDLLDFSEPRLFYSGYDFNISAK